MSLIARITRTAPADTVGRFRSAARQRYNEARRLAAAGDRLASIYLWGYSGEMVLKAAYFRLRGWATNQPIHFTDLRDARNRALHIHHLTWPQVNYHDLVRWGELLVAERSYGGAAYPRLFGYDLLAQVNRLYSNWRETLRYCPNRPHQREVTAADVAATWLLEHSRRL